MCEEYAHNILEWEYVNKCVKLSLYTLAVVYYPIVHEINCKLCLHRSVSSCPVSCYSQSLISNTTHLCNYCSLKKVLHSI